MKFMLIGGALAAIFGAAAIMTTLISQSGEEWRIEMVARQEAYRAQEAERAAQAEVERRAAELAAQREAQAPVSPVIPGQGFSPLNPLASSGTPTGTAAAAYDGPVRDDLGGLPDTPGVEPVYYMCSACHGLGMVTQQHVTRERWDYLLTWMVEEQGMGELGDDRAVVLDYLERHFGPN